MVVATVHDTRSSAQLRRWQESGPCCTKRRAGQIERLFCEQDLLVMFRERENEFVFANSPLPGTTSVGPGLAVEGKLYNAKEGKDIT